MNIDYSLYVILDARASQGRSLLDIAQSSVKGGATVLQLREKNLTTRQLVYAALELRMWAHEAHVPYIINDRVDIALAVDADGVHLGPDDLPLDMARRILGPQRVIGVSAGTVEEAREAERAGADYIGVGAVFATASKADAGEPIGVGGFGEIARAVSIPAVAIGGVGYENAALPVAAGAAGVAVISAVVGAPDVERATREMRRQIEQARSAMPGARPR